MPALLARRSETRAERVVQREYEQLRRPTLSALRSRLASQGITFDAADLDEFYNQAWHGLYEQLLSGAEVENRGGFLVVAAHRRAIEELRRIHPDRRADGLDAGESGAEVDLAQRLDDRRRVLGVMEGMRDRLSERERQAAALCYLHGYSRPEAAEAMGLAPKRMEKLMDGVSRKLATLTREIDSGDWCESRQSLMKAYAYGILDPDGERYALARAHLDECPACRRYVRGLRGIAAVVPPVWLPLAGLGLMGAAGAGGAAAASAGSSAPGGSAAAGGAGATGTGAAGGIGGWGIAAAACAAIAAGGIGAYAVVSGGDEQKQATPPPVAAPPATTSASAAGGSPQAGASSAAKRRASARRAAARERARRAAGGGEQGGAASPGTSAATTPVAAQPAPQPAEPAAPEPAEPEPVAGDDGSEFGFER